MNAHADRIAPGSDALAVALFVVFWLWETWNPLVHRSHDRLARAGQNVVITILNAVLLGSCFGLLTREVTGWTGQAQLGLLNHLKLGGAARIGLSLVLLDAWMYVWHRANHAVPMLWRLHRVHHSDSHMDVTTTGRFHPGEYALGFSLRCGMIVLLGLRLWDILLYQALVVGVTQLHHANISLGGVDRWLRLILVTPDMHRIHHSSRRAETDSNYATVFSFWDRLAVTYRMRTDGSTVHVGLDGFDAGPFQSVPGMLLTPFRRRNVTDSASQSRDSGH